MRSDTSPTDYDVGSESREQVEDSLKRWYVLERS